MMSTTNTHQDKQKKDKASVNILSKIKIGLTNNN